MANLIKAKIITPHGLFFSGESNIITVKTTEGYTGIQKGHIPLVASIVPSKLTIGDSSSHNAKVAAIANGLLFANRDEITIITDAVEYRDKIDLKRAEKALKDAEDKLNNNLDSAEFARLNLAMRKALNRIEVRKV